MKKIELINEYIDRCNCVIASNIKNNAKTLLDKIISTFKTEIPNIRSQLDCYSPANFYTNRSTDYFGDIKLLPQKLINYSAKIQLQQDKIDSNLQNKIKGIIKTKGNSKKKEKLNTYKNSSVHLNIQIFKNHYLKLAY